MRSYVSVPAASGIPACLGRLHAYAHICLVARASQASTLRRRCRNVSSRWPQSVAATLAANVAHGLGHGLLGAAVAAWPAVALVGSYELLMVIIRSAQMPQQAPAVTTDALQADPLQVQAAQLFADDLAADRVPSIRAIRARLHIGQPRAQRVRAYLAALGEG
jgi:hypothetical protein